MDKTLSARQDSLVHCYRGLVAQGKTHEEALRHCSLRFGVFQSTIQMLIKARA